MCGLGFVADIGSNASHDVVARSLAVLRRLAHRGAVGSDPLTSDGAGILIQIPHLFFERELERVGIELPNPLDYGVIQAFLSRDPARCAAQMRILESVVRYHNQVVVGWRDVPTDNGVLGPLAEQTRPVMKQLFVGRVAPPAAFERTLFMIRKRAGRRASELGPDFYVASASSRTIVYKALTLPEQLHAFYTDLSNRSVRSSLAIVHSRFSTNTVPSWERAHPYRRIAHNGEINTLRGNQTWMAAREPLLESPTLAEHLGDFKPIIRPNGSDSASLDNVVDFLIAGGRPIAHVMMMLVPEAWSSEVDMPAERRAFYAHHASLVEPWDGPAALVFTDGNVVGATLDRNGLRPAKYVVTQSGLVVMASELGVADFEDDDIVEKGRLAPGQMLLVDVGARRLLHDDEIKTEMASRRPYARWVADATVTLADIAPAVTALRSSNVLTNADELTRIFGLTDEERRVVIAPMAERGEEPTGSMGNDTTLAVLSDRPVSLFRYFKQQFAQVTNPPIDPIRESLVMSLDTYLGGEGNLLDEGPRRSVLALPCPVLSSAELERVLASAHVDLRATRLDMLFDASIAAPGEALAAGLDALCRAALAAVAEGATILVLGDRAASKTHAPIPSLLACSAVHHALIRAGKRMRCSLVIESGEPRDVSDVALLVGFGAAAVNPYLALHAAEKIAGERGAANYVKAVDKGLRKILAKMGISTIAGYRGAQIFEAIGISRALAERYFPGVASRLSGIGMDEIAREALARHGGESRDAGVYAWRRDGERHAWSPTAIAKLRHAARENDSAAYEAFTRAANDEAAPVQLRGVWEIAPAGPAVPLDEVEPASSIVRRFATGAMSFGSISKEAHETLALAMNRIGGRSNSGEGGEDAARFADTAEGSRRSAIKQVASARFGVTTHYLVNADEIQIKIAQGAKPGEGGQLPGHKVDAVIARVRHATPGVTLISPPPHHDIYSIEDLAQLVLDLKSVNPSARVSVKLVSESGVGTIAAGVVKAHADAVLIAGHDGGTGASPLSSIHNAGAPWEIGLAETQQVLVSQALRPRVRLQVDGQLKTGRDVAFAALLGAEEFGFATAPLVASGCVLTRKCHENTCPVGIATQDPVLRARFRGEPEHVVRYFFFVAEELRAIMAEHGFCTVDEMVGRVDCIRPRARRVSERASTSIRPGEHGWGEEKACMLDFGELLTAPGERAPRRYALSRARELEPTPIERELTSAARLSLKYKEPTSMRVTVTNAERAFGARLAGEIARLWGAEGLPEATISIEARGTGGQSFGAFAASGMLLALEGDANDYVGKGLSGGTVAIFPPRRSRYRACDNVIIGNTCLYGATSGKAFFAGRAGDRFAVRNSGAVAVVEGAGDHACEYMTGGVVLVLGAVGRNFGAGMSGGLAYVVDDGTLRKHVSRASQLAIGALDSEGAEVVRELLAEHVLLTRSARGAALLSDWTTTRRRIARVIPVEYERALTARGAKEAP